MSTEEKSSQRCQEFEEFVSQELGDVAVWDNGRYISPKIQNYKKVWDAAIAYMITNS